MRRAITFLLLIFQILAHAQTDIQKSTVIWTGYTQLRFISNFDNVNSFAMRRMKLWINSAPGFSEHWGFHVQTTITSNQNEKFLLQDVLAFYQRGQFRVNLGQFVPNFSLQRFQPDFEIPQTERADVINALIPNGTLGIRDIGVEINYSTKDDHLQAWLGAFNGYGIKEYRLDNSGILLTQKTAFNFLNKHLYAGYSVMFRKNDKIQLSKVLPDTVLYSGDDFRYNLFAQYISKKFQIQSEYIWANLGGNVARGYYILSVFCLGKSQLSASWNRYKDIIESTDDLPVLHFGYNYLVNGDKLKIMFDNGLQMNEGKLQNYFGTIQLQLFFN
jgi:hypothetical protein